MSGSEDDDVAVKALVAEHFWIAIAVTKTLKQHGEKDGNLWDDVMFSAATTGLWRAAHDYLYAQPVEDNVTFATFAWRRARTDAIDAWRTAKHSKAKAEVVPYAEYGYSPKTGKPAFGDSNAGHPGEHICAEAGLDELLDQARNPRDRKMLALISEGMHYREVGEQIGVTESRVCQILKTYRAPTRHLL